MTEKNTIQAAADTAKNLKATRIVLTDIGPYSGICESMLVCSVTNARQATAVADAIADELKLNFDLRPIQKEGMQTGQWVVLDYGSLVIHIFQETVRDFYALEKLWPQARQQTFN